MSRHLTQAVKNVMTQLINGYAIVWLRPAALGGLDLRNCMVMYHQCP